jgi:hypothetical protein
VQQDKLAFEALARFEEEVAMDPHMFNLTKEDVRMLYASPGYAQDAATAQEELTHQARSSRSPSLTGCMHFSWTQSAQAGTTCTRC